MKTIYRAYIQHLGEGDWAVHYDVKSVVRETQSRWYYKGTIYHRHKPTEYNVERWKNKESKNGWYETKEEALDNLIFRRERFQEITEYKAKYNKDVIKQLCEAKLNRETEVRNNRLAYW